MLLVVVTIIVSPYLLTIFQKTTSARFYQIGMLTDPGPVMQINEGRFFCSGSLPPPICSLISNKLITYSQIFVERFSKIFSLKFLFISGEDDIIQYGVDNFGQFSILLIPYYIFGLFSFFIKDSKKNKLILLFVLICLFAASLPAVIAGSPQKVRLSPLVPFVTMVIIFGFEYLKNIIKNANYKRAYITFSFLAVFIYGIFFTTHFLTIDIRKHENLYGTYIKRLMSFIDSQKDARIYIKSFFSEPLMYYAFHTKLNPKIYQTKTEYAAPDKIGYTHARKINNIISEENIDINKIIELEKNNKRKIIYITNEKLRDNEEDKAVLYIGKTENDVLGLVYAYDLRLLVGEDR